MTIIQVVKRHPAQIVKFHMAAEKLYYDGMEADAIADTLNRAFIPSMIVTTLEVGDWIASQHWLRRAERTKPAPPPPLEPTVTKATGQWEPLWSGWMQ
jgi:hypothetical protein